MNTSQTQKTVPFISSSLYVEWVENVQGWGVFTKDTIDAYTIVEICPVIIYPQEVLKIAAWNSDNLLSLGLSMYSLLWDESNVIVPLGWGGMYNHSDTNNCQFFSDKENGFLGVISLRSLKVDEQLTVFYGKDWFSRKGMVKVDL